MRPRLSATAVLTSAILLVAACSGGAEGPERGSPPPPASSTGRSSPAPRDGTSGGTLKVSGTVTEDLDSPWGLALLPGGAALVASRDTGRVQLVAADGRRRQVGTVPGVTPGGEGGLLGLAVSPAFRKDHLVYAYLTSARDNRIVRMPLENERLGRPSLVLGGIPKGTIHNGGRIAFGPDGMLYAGTGESGEPGLAQDRGSLGGKILRMEPDGDPAPGNPFKGSVVYSYGHRNVQGLAWDSEGRLWASEFGQDTWDELNVIRPGANYGWPVAEGRSRNRAYVNPVAQWHPDEASPSGIAYARGAIWLAGLRGARLWRVPVSGGRAGAPRAFLTGEYGRLRTVVRVRPGTLWLTTSNTDGRGDVRPGDDRILRLTVR